MNTVNTMNTMNFKSNKINFDAYEALIKEMGVGNIAKKLGIYLPICNPNKCKNSHFEPHKCKFSHKPNLASTKEEQNAVRKDNERKLISVILKVGCYHNVMDRPCPAGATCMFNHKDDTPEAREKKRTKRRQNKENRTSRDNSPCSSTPSSPVTEKPTLPPKTQKKITTPVVKEVCESKDIYEKSVTHDVDAIERENDEKVAICFKNTIDLIHVLLNQNRLKSDILFRNLSDCSPSES